MWQELVGQFPWSSSNKPIAYTDLTFRDKAWKRKVDETVKSAVMKLIESWENPIIVWLEEEIELYRDIPWIESHIIEVPMQVESEYTSQFPDATRGQKNLSYAADIMMERRSASIKPKWVVAGNQTHTWLVLWSFFKQMWKLEADKKLSSHFIMDHLSHKFLLSDGWVAVDPTAKELADIIYYTVLSANNYKMKPVVALIDWWWKNPKTKEAYDIAKKSLEDVWIIDIEWHIWVSFKEAHERKASVIIAPDLNTWNIWYKVAQRVECCENLTTIDFWESFMHNFDSNFWNINFMYEKESSLNSQDNFNSRVQELVDTALRGIWYMIEKWQKPKVAFVSYSTCGKQGEKFQLYDIPRKAADSLRKYCESEWIDVEIEWDIQFDAACIPEIAEKKLKDRKSEFWDSSANLFIFPDTDSWATCSDIVQTVPWSEAIGPIVDGCILAANDLSRWAKVDDIIAMHHITKNMNK